MRVKATLNPLNSLIVIGGGDSMPSLAIDGRPVPYVTDGTIVVGTMVDVDGPTVVEISDRIPDALAEIVSEVLVSAPSGLLVRDVLGSVALRVPATSAAINVRVFANHPIEPDRIVIVPTVGRGSGDY